MTWATAGDVCSVRSATATARPAHPNLVLAACILASSLAFVDGSVVNVGLPAIGRALNGNAAELQWVINAYLLPLSALLLLGGAAGDRFGRRTVLVLGATVFGLASVSCAAAPGLGWLLVGRAIQGTGAAFVLPNSLAILGGAFAGEARGRAIGIWSAASAITSAIGPVLGGWLIDAFGWREIFLLNIPLTVGAIGLALAFVRDGPDDAGVQAPFDLLGALLAAASLALLTWGLTIGAGRSGWTSPALEAVIIGAALLAVFLGTEKRRGNAAMVPLALFGSADFVALSLLTILLYGALGGLLLLVPYVLIQGSGFSATDAGAALLPFPLVVAVLSPAMGAVAGRIGSRLPLALGPLIVAAGFLLFLPFGAGSNYWSGLLPAIMVVSFGMSGAVAPLTNAVLASVDPRHAGSASGLNSALARLGGLIATALLGGVFSQKGQALFAAFHVAVIACAAAACAAGIAVFALMKSRRSASDARI